VTVSGASYDHSVTTTTPDPGSDSTHPAEIMVGPHRNWSQNLTYTAQRLFQPSSVEQLQELVAGQPRLRALGSRHSFNDVADTDGVLVSVAGLPRRVEIDPATSTAIVSGGLRYAQITPALVAAGFALPNTGSLPHISIAGACATGTHGSGVANRNLPSAVNAVEFVDGQGELRRLSRADDGDRFAGSVLALGALGIVTSFTLDLLPNFAVRQHVYLDLALAEALANLEEILGAAYSVSLFTALRDDAFDTVWLKHLAEDPRPIPPIWHGARLAEFAQHPVPGHDPTAATEQLGRPGPWNERLPHFRAEFVPSDGDEVQSEYLLPRENAQSALSALFAIRQILRPALMVCEIRTVAADDLWLSPAYGRDVVALHFTWFNEWTAVRPALVALENALDGLGARGHWGKLAVTEPAVVRADYERLADFQALAAEFDPERRFGNRFLETYVY
jgi:xylitol oxidase